MSNNDEFGDVRNGLPLESSSGKKSAKLVTVFLIAAIVITLFILLFQGLIDSLSQAFFKNNYIVIEAICGAAISMCTGIVQALIFRSRIKTQVLAFVFYAFLGGLIGGVIGGLIRHLGVHIAILVGALIGFIGGTSSSALQNFILKNSKYSSHWFAFSAFSWTLIYAFTWVISWQLGGINGLAVSAGFLMLASGIALVFFLKQNLGIEFS